MPIEAGEGQIIVRCLSTFPVNAAYDLRVAVSVDDGNPQTISARTKAMEHDGNDWHKTVLAGFSPAIVSYSSTIARKAKVPSGCWIPVS